MLCRPLRSTFNSNIRPVPSVLKVAMKRIFCAVGAISAMFALTSCGSGSKGGAGVASVSLINTFAFVIAGSDPIAITATVAGAGGDQGVSWNLSIGNSSCAPSCGTLKPAPAPSMSAQYTPPKQVGANETATITAQAIADPTQTFVFSFQIRPTIRVTIMDPFVTVTPGGPVTDIHAGIENDTTNAGVIWSLTSLTTNGQNGQSCSPECGTLVADAPQLLTAHYQPPATMPAGAAVNPMITATSVAVPANSNRFIFSIGVPMISVTITNKFSGLLAGDPTVTVHATVPNDVGGGVAWTLTASGADCTPDCGTLTEVGSPSVSAKYAPPKVLPVGPAANPTITATSVADASKSDSFTFTIATASAVLNGAYAFQLRGFNPSGTAPVAIAGAFVADGAGGISIAEFELNSGGSVVSSSAGGTYDVVTFSGIPRVTITLNSMPVSLVLKCAMSSDGKRGQIIQMDGSGFLTSGTLLQQDPTALAADPAGSYAFGVDSDAPVGQRIVEAGQFVLGAGGKSIPGGLADAIQFGGASPVAGGVNGGAAISMGTATAPDSFGRGTMTLNVGGTGNVQYSYYVIDGQRMNLLETDAGTALNSLFSGTARRQKALDSNTINSAGVLALTGTNLVNGTTVAPDTAIGLFTIGGTTATATYDRNTGTSVSTLQQVSGSVGSAGFDPGTGRVLVANTIVTEMALYYYDAGSAYAIDISPSTASHALSGQLVPRAPGRFSASADLSGNLIARAGGSSTAEAPNVDFAATFDGIENDSFLLDFTTTNTSLGSNGQIVDYSATDPTDPNNLFQIDDTMTGHGSFRLAGAVLGDPSPTAADNVSFYFIGPKQFVAIGNKAGVPSGVLVFDPKDPQ